MSVRAKFSVQSITRSNTMRAKKNPDGSFVRPEGSPTGYVHESAELQTIKLSPVYANGDPNHENTKFWESSPSGSIELGTVNAAAAAQFELGKEYYIDFTPADG